jgi:putative two-component system response regulator
MADNKETIIIVDDNKTNLTAARNNLSEQYAVFTVPSGEKLFFLLEKINPALILLDIEMPEMNGYEVLEKLKSADKTAYIPVIFLTANIDPENEAKGLNLGAVDYITKPFSRELLAKQID